jgi:hypothetical protein
MSDEINLDAALSAAFDKITSEPAAPEPTAQDTADIAPDTDEVESKVEAESPTEPVESQEQEAEPVEQPLSPPSRWSSELKEKFANLPREAQEIMLEREKDGDKYLTQKSQEFAEHKKKYEALEQILNTNRHVIAKEGGDAAAAVSRLLQISDYANNDPVGFVKWFAAQRSLNLDNLFSQEKQNSIDLEYADPIVKTALNEVNELKLRISKQEDERKQVVLSQIQREISDFREAKDEKGELLHPHFEKVRMDMQAIFTANPSTNLKAAYEQAIWSNPTTRAEILAQMEKAQEAKKIEEAKIAANKAAKAIGVKPKSTFKTYVKPKNWEDGLSSLYDQLQEN